SLSEGSATLTDVVVATFTDSGNPAPGANEDASDYAATIDWGDGSLLDTGLIVNNGDGTWSVKGSHTYLGDSVNGASEGAATITVKVSHDATAVKTVTDTATISYTLSLPAALPIFSLSEGSATLTDV